MKTCTCAFQKCLVRTTVYLYPERLRLLQAVGVEGVVIVITFRFNVPGVYLEGPHLFPSRTQKLSPPRPMVLGPNPVLGE
mgnify:CR=1 FL=1